MVFGELETLIDGSSQVLATLPVECCMTGFGALLYNRFYFRVGSNQTSLRVSSCSTLYSNLSWYQVPYGKLK